MERNKKRIWTEIDIQVHCGRILSELKFKNLHIDYTINRPRNNELLLQISTEIRGRCICSCSVYREVAQVLKV